MGGGDHGRGMCCWWALQQARAARPLLSQVGIAELLGQHGARLVIIGADTACTWVCPAGSPAGLRTAASGHCSASRTCVSNHDVALKYASTRQAWWGVSARCTKEAGMPCIYGCCALLSPRLMHALPVCACCCCLQMWGYRPTQRLACSACWQQLRSQMGCGTQLGALARWVHTSGVLACVRAPANTLQHPLCIVQAAWTAATLQYSRTPRARALCS